MTYQTCEDCGTKLYGDRCGNCHEETFIADQYRDLGEPVPESIAKAEVEQYAAITRRGATTSETKSS